MTDIATIIERLKQNEEITKKFHEIETRILSIVNFRDLFEVLLVLIKEKFNVPYVWISMIEQSEDTVIPVSVSFGVAATEDDLIETADHLLKKADEMLYASKKLKKARG